ncbi:hypothetical protein [Streptomyces malaysiensis]|nr:hypothetical protein [Streptomyces samsunensis]
MTPPQDRRDAAAAHEEVSQLLLSLPVLLPAGLAGDHKDLGDQ